MTHKCLPQIARSLHNQRGLIDELVGADVNHMWGLALEVVFKGVGEAFGVLDEVTLTMLDSLLIAHWY